ncbi:MAG: glutamine-hydrolyzing carbamoyl-phosphate synthase small subunit [Nitrospinae bacterium]|nr:glutamine-hydrolyzing carbamoyl-phosphate synthase small subunit [Nitrospinota bacterium]
MKAVLALEDGRIFEGVSFGASADAIGEVVFNTGMSGYQEVLTDPSYHGQIVVMTYPLIGNYGVNKEDGESAKIQVRAFVVKEPSSISSNFRSEQSLGDYLKSQNVSAICGLDTRALTRHIRSKGAMRGVISTADVSPETLVERARASESMNGADLASVVTTTKKYSWGEGLWNLGKGFGKAPTGKTYEVAALDFGIKRNILRHLVERGCKVTVYPAKTTANEILGAKPDGVFLSNGPGDPSAVSYAMETVRGLVGKIPMFGICLGHQIMCLALGAKTFKLKFGHRGLNHPVMDIFTGNIVRITSQNHGFAVDKETLPADLELTHYSLYDGTVEGVRHKKQAAFSVQYHPEAAPGPHDTSVHFDQFIKLMEGGATRGV